MSTPHPNLPPAGIYIVPKGEPFPEWLRLYMSAPWAMARDMEIEVDEFGGVTINRMVKIVPPADGIIDMLPPK